MIDRYVTHGDVGRPNHKDLLNNLGLGIISPRTVNSHFCSIHNDPGIHFHRECPSEARAAPLNRQGYLVLPVPSR